MRLPWGAARQGAWPVAESDTIIAMSFVPKNSPTYSDFAKKINEWKDCIHASTPSGSLDGNSIVSQIQWMIENVRRYQLFRTALKHCESDENGRPRVNKQLCLLIKECYGVTQMVAIRRQTETNARKGEESGMSGPKGVWSLRSLVDDMSKNCKLLTRSNYNARASQKLSCQASGRGTTSLAHEFKNGPCWASERECAIVDAGEVNRRLDRLAGVADCSRKPEDQVSASYFQCFVHDLIAIGNRFDEAVNKYLAHASTQHSRKQKDVDNPIINHHVVEDAICKLASIMNAIAVDICADSNHPLIFSDDDARPMQYLDHALVPAGCIPELEKHWRDYAKSIEERAKYVPV